MDRKFYKFYRRSLVVFLLALLFSGGLFAQTKITGVVKDEKNQPLPGVNVTVKGTTTGSNTNPEGVFSLTAKPDAILVFSFVGYNPQEVAVGGKTTVNVSLTPLTTSINEVVVLAYGSQSKREITGAVQTVSGKELQDQPAAQFTQKLQGKLAGVQITQTTGTPGGGMAVRIRGSASISAGNNPLYVVDGFPIVGDISNINPDEIENISVLKDASSTSLYGSRAANGVVIVTTKHGSAGKTTVSLNAYRGFQAVPQKGRPDMMNAQEFAQFKKEVATDNGQAVDPLFQNPASLGKGTDWYSAVLRTAPIENYSISINSNKDKLSTAVVIGFFNQDGVLRQSNYKRYSIRANTDYRVNDWFKLGANVAPTFSENNTPQSDGIWYNTSGIIQGAILTSPLAPFKNADGSIPINTSGYGTLDAPNWYNELYTTKNNTKTNRLLANGYVEADPIPGLAIKSSINVDYGQAVYNNFTPSTNGGFFNPGSLTDASRIHATTSNNLYFSWLWENTVNYKKSLGKHNFEALIGYTSQYFRNEGSSINASNFPDNLVQTINAASTFTATGSVEEFTLLSYVARLNYNFSNKYLLSAAIRRDGSSRFGTDRRYGNFPSVSAGWVASDEDFMKSFKTVSNLKFRASYGTIGNNNIGNYTQYATVVGTNYPFNNSLANGRSIAGLNNTLLGWETSKEADFGIDLGILNNRISFSYDYYNKITDNLLYSVDIPISSGFFNYTTNVGKLKFWGHEFNISTKNLVGEFKWNTNFNISFNKNKVLALGTANAAIYGDLTITQVGQPLGQFYAYKFDGIANNQAEFDAAPKYPGMEVGMARFKDINGDGQITFDNRDKEVLGNPSPKFVYGMTNSFAYKNFDLSVVVAGQYGNKLANRIEPFTENLDGAFNVTRDVANRWRSPTDVGDGRYGKDISGTTGYERDNASSRLLYDASFLTVKNVTLGYTVPVKNNKYIHSVRLYASGQQLFVFTKYPGANPEASGDAYGNQASPLNLGSDYSNYPVPRTITFGANCNF
ncbi:TonB-dependent receptor [Mucilaginibacter sp.]|uniref:SusC/RagA family TonB-linked outer membrane protein n=1 Tax=Mucilaginibacter sp. TaxID=1882438 RepID=UPI002ED67F2D